MKLSLLFLGGAAASAVPRLRGARSRMSRHGNPPIFTEQFSPAEDHVLYNENWAGAVLVTSNLRTVSGTTVVGPARLPSSTKPNTDYATSTWVGIDGYNCNGGLWQSGVDTIINSSSGKVRYEPWLEWYPGGTILFNGFDVKLGDKIKMTVTASSATAGTATLENLTTGTKKSQSLSGQPALCFKSADWIVEDFYSVGSSTVLFADFETVTISDATATKADGSTTGLSGSQIFGIEHGSKIYTDCSTSGSSSVTCKYTG